MDISKINEFKYHIAAAILLIAVIIMATRLNVTKNRMNFLELNLADEQKHIEFLTSKNKDLSKREMELLKQCAELHLENNELKFRKPETKIIYYEKPVTVDDDASEYYNSKLSERYK